MVQYAFKEKGATKGGAAPTSGVLNELLNRCHSQYGKIDFNIVSGDSAWK